MIPAAVMYPGEQNIFKSENMLWWPAYSIPAILKLQEINFVKRWHYRSSGSSCKRIPNANLLIN